MQYFETRKGLGNKLVITLLRKAGFACRPILGGEFVSQLESAGGNRAFRRGKQRISSLRRNESVYTYRKHEKSLKPLAAEIFS